MAGVSGLQNDWRTFLQRQPIVDRTTASRQAPKLDWFYEVRHLSTSLGLVEAGLGISALLVWQCPMRPILRLLVSHWWNPLYVGHWGLFAAKMPCFLRQLNAFALLINLWTDDKDNLWTNIVERQRHALQEIG